MNTNVRNIVIAVAISAGLSFAWSLLMSIGGEHAGWGSYLGCAMIGLFVFYILNNLAGNRAEAKADPHMRAQALSFTPPAGRAMIYVVRSGFVASMAGMNISVDGRIVAQLKSPRFTCVDLAPGAHEIDAALGGGAGAQSNGAKTSLTLAAGEVAVLHATIKMGGIKNNIALERMAPDAARDLIGKTEMVAPDAVTAAA